MKALRLISLRQQQIIGLKRKHNKTEVDAQLNQIGVIPSFNFFNGEVVQTIWRFIARM